MSFASTWISASAGTGKTNAVVERCVQLRKGQEHCKILCLTFTNAATHEMRERIQKRCQGEGLDIQTFNGYCTNIIRRYADLLDLSKDFVMLDDWACIALQRTAMREAFNACDQLVQEFLQGFSRHFLEDACAAILAMRYIIPSSQQDNFIKSNHKMNQQIDDIISEARTVKVPAKIGLLGTPDRARAIEWLHSKGQGNISAEFLNVFLNNDASYFSELLLQIAQTVIFYYNALKAERNACDHEDSIYLTLHLLAKHHFRDNVLYALHQGIDHLIIDEAQDLSREQWQIIELICENFWDSSHIKTICAVGDVKQSIYSFRGAVPELFIKLGHKLQAKSKMYDLPFDFVTLNHCYRSCPKVLSVIDALFSSNAQLMKALYLQQPLRHVSAIQDTERSLVEVWPLFDNIDDLVQRIAQTILLDGTDVMVLIRMRSAFDRKLSEALGRLGIPSIVNSKVTMLEDPVVKDMLAVGDFVLDPDNAQARVRILLLAGIPFTDVMNIGEHPKLQALSALYGKFTHEVGAFYVGAFELLRDCFVQGYGGSSLVLAHRILDMSLNHTDLSCFLKWLREFYNYSAPRDIGHSGALITTVHKAKGLQASTVFVVDDCRMPKIQDTVLYDQLKKPWCYKQPYKKSSVIARLRKEHEERSLEEYYRVLYVALTRSKYRLYLCGWCRQKTPPSASWGALFQGLRDKNIVGLVCK